MRSVSAEFLTALRGPHKMVVEVDILQFGQMLLPNLDVIDGSVTLDAGAAIYATCEVTVAQFELLGRGLSPFGLELAIKRGVSGHRPTDELVPLGVFKVVSYDMDGVSGTLRMSGMDRSKFATDARLEDDVEFAAGTLVTDAIEDLISVAVPHAQQVLATSGHTIPLSVFAMQTVPWEAVQELAGVIGKQARFDGIGTLRLVDVTSPIAPVSWTVDEGAEGVLLSASMAASDDEIFNRVIAASPPNDTGVVYRAVVSDTTTSAIYGGPFGKKPDFIESDLFTSDQMALDAATARLNTGLGGSRSISFAAVPNCALEAGDVILIRNEALDLDTKHVIETLTIGLSVDAQMSGTTRVAM
jgi:hypothetical protein